MNFTGDKFGNLKQNVYIASDNNKNITIMKKILFFSIATAIVCGIMLWHNLANNLSEQFRYDGKFIWEHQLDYVKEHNSVADNPLKLVKYEYVKPLDGIVDASSYLKNTFSDKAYFGFESTREACKFEVFRKKDFVKQYDSDGAQKALDDIKNEVSKRFMLVGYAHIVEITWEYQGKRFKTRALVANDDKGVLYDNIATAIPNPRPTDKVEWKKYIIPVNLLKSDDRSVNNIKDKLTFKIFQQSDHHPSMNYVGRYMWEYAIACESRFLTKDGTNFGMKMGQIQTSEPGYECNAQITTLSDMPEGSKRHAFSWQIKTNERSVVVHSQGLQVSSSGKQELGQEVHTADSQMAVR